MPGKIFGKTRSICGYEGRAGAIVALAAFTIVFQNKFNSVLY